MNHFLADDQSSRDYFRDNSREDETAQIEQEKDQLYTLIDDLHAEMDDAMKDRDTERLWVLCETMRQHCVKLKDLERG